MPAPDGDGSVDLPPLRRRLLGVDRDAARRHLDALAARLAAVTDERDRLAARVAELEVFDEDRARAVLGAEVDRRLAEVREAAAAEVEATKQTCREMLDETREVRARMLADLARRRDAARAQIAALVAERDRLLAVLAEVRAAVAAVEASVGTLEGPADDEEVSFAPVTMPVPVVPGGATAPTEPDHAEAPVPATTGSRPDRPVNPHAEVDALFARIRSAGASAVVARTGAPAADPGDGGGPARPAPPEPAPPEPAPPGPLAERSATLAPIEVAVARRLKRHLADEQNAVLDDLRRREAAPTLEEAVGPLDDHAARFRTAVADDLLAAATAGARSVAADRPDLDLGPVVGVVLDRLTADLVVPFRDRLARCVADAGGDPVEAAALLRAAYREWKTQRIDEIAADLVLAAHGAGVFAALTPGTAVCWLVDPEAPPCPDADDNALAGPVPAGAPFPTGHTHPPAHPGCRCLLAEAGR